MTNCNSFSRKSKNADFSIQTIQECLLPCVPACSDSPFPIDVFVSFPRILCHWPHPLRLVWLRTCFGCLAKGSRRCHLSLHVHNLASGVCGFKYWLFLTHHGQSFLERVMRAVSVCHLNVIYVKSHTCKSHVYMSVTSWHIVKQPNVCLGKRSVCMYVCTDLAMHQFL